MKPTYAETAKKCLDRLGHYNLNMANFKTEEVCGTSFCMLGDLIEQAGSLVCPVDYCEGGVLGFSLTSNLGAWLFGSQWSNDIDLAKKRCEYAIKYGRPPTAFNPNERLSFKYFELALKD